MSTDTTQAGVALRGRNPDVLTCIANLSNDEVFTPPELANKILDAVADRWAANNGGADIWSDPTVRFLDPFTKSGVFLREITDRLVRGLEHEIPDLPDRVDHILIKQVYGIGITHLSVYCSKVADGVYSIAKSFDSDAGNIVFERVEHTWVGGTEWVLTADAEGNEVRKFKNGKCKYCDASQKTLDRGDGLETHAYVFIHTDDIKARIAVPAEETERPSHQQLVRRRRPPRDHLHHPDQVGGNRCRWVSAERRPTLLVPTAICTAGEGPPTRMNVTGVRILVAVAEVVACLLADR